MNHQLQGLSLLSSHPTLPTGLLLSRPVPSQPALTQESFPSSPLHTEQAFLGHCDFLGSVPAQVSLLAGVLPFERLRVNGGWNFGSCGSSKLTSSAAPQTETVVKQDPIFGMIH